MKRLQYTRSKAQQLQSVMLRKQKQQETKSPSRVERDKLKVPFNTQLAFTSSLHRGNLLVSSESSDPFQTVVEERIDRLGCVCLLLASVQIAAG